MFTVVLFAAYLSILWQNYETNRAPLWLLPVLMIAWVNLHLGFIAGLLLMAAFAGFDMLNIVASPARRSETLQRLRHTVPWIAVTAVCTLVNPWGWGLFRAILRQNRAMGEHSQLISEWAKAKWNWSGTIPSFVHSPVDHTLTVLMVIVMIAALVAVWERRWTEAILLMGAMYESMQHVRMEALTACTVVVVAGAVFSALATRMTTRWPRSRWQPIAAVAATALIVLLAVLRSTQFVTDRAYLARNSLNGFGAGPGWWFPIGAAEFMNRENLPANVFNSYDEGGFLVWKVGLKYRDYIDGRAIPFGEQAIPREEQLLGESVASADWQQEADRYNINTLVLPLMGNEIPLEQLPDLCYGDHWTPVYLDELSIVLVRRRPENEPLINRLQVNCANEPLPGKPLDDQPRSFQKWLNTAHVLHILRRDSEALSAAEHAFRIFPDSAELLRVRGSIFYASSRRTEAEQDWLAALDLAPDPAVWFELGELYEKQDRIPDAIHAWEQAVVLTSNNGANQNPAERTIRSRSCLKLARLYVMAGKPRAALQALDEAESSASPAMLNATGRSLTFDVAQGRAAAWRSLGDLQQATAFEEEAVKLDPNAADAWSHLAKLYAKQGRADDQRRAEAHASALPNP